MYESKTFKNFLDTKGHYAGYAREFQRFDDAELLDKLYQYVGQMTLSDIDSDHYDAYFGDVQRMIECMCLRQEYRQQLAEDELS